MTGIQAAIDYDLEKCWEPSVTQELRKDTQQPADQEKHTQNTASKLQDLYDKSRFIEPVISADISEAVSSMGTRLEGTEFSVKTANSIHDKLQRMEQYAIEHNKPFYPTTEFGRMKDIIRYTEICSHDNIIATTGNTISQLENKGYVLSGIKNYYSHPFPKTGYMGIHMNFISPYGNEFELQVHSPESFAAKQEGHALYEKLRSVATMAQDKERLSVEITRIHQSVKRPKDYETLVDYRIPREKRNKLAKEHARHVNINIEKTPVDNMLSTAYTVSMDGNRIFSGFDNRFEDGSVQRYQFDERVRNTKISTIDKSGTEVSEHTSIAIEITKDAARLIMEAQKKAHTEWMREHMAEKEKEELESHISQETEPDMALQPTIQKEKKGNEGHDDR